MSAEDGWKGYDDGYAYTAPVGSYKPNELGLYDMSGNVYEWVVDCYIKNYYKNSPKYNPKRLCEGKCKILRGGSWNPLPKIVWTTNRFCNVPGARGSWMGFRLAYTAKSGF